MDYTITRYRKSRNFAVMAGQELLAVTVYKRGAQAIVKALRERDAIIDKIQVRNA